ncbi:MAG: primosomal protein N' [Candidatus Yanofskybacteria bacterium RIFCSPHIGHO2_02_FULL_39_10]|uniref:Probable replication restart protein PriA n=1 Tax=Candidatus Yanofskybacteria bacterium RIFCSPHIGHO2_02_FULL_39_10 TaxID=1802674 RepID=A0A1F8FAK1_9BACT|nr:MAG: primosomal protein N' [Candidatus Yanofskybacteria bacterium RIFCSPHIGHO2_02_FULL_39_10]
MFIIEVIPLATLPSQVPQLLSYFFNKPLNRGSVVEVLIGNRRVPAIVVSSSPLESQKASLKKSGFQLKKISTVLNEIPQVSEARFKIALWLSKNYYAPLGLCLKTVLPSFFGKKNYETPVENIDLVKPLQPVNVTIYLSPAKDTKTIFEPEIKKVLAQKKQILLILPEISLIDYFYNWLAGYYETAVINGKIPSKKLYQNWKNIASGKTEIIIGTRQAIFAPFKNLGLIIIEDPSNEGYKSDMTPKYETSNLTRNTAVIYNCPILYSARINDIKNYFYTKRGLYELRNKNSKKRPDIKTIDMVQEIQRGNFSALSYELKDTVKEYIEKKKKILILSSRRGYSSLLVCRNCGSVGTCPKCSLPMKFYKTPESILVCHRCSESKKAPSFCPNCNSSEIRATGIPGSQKLQEEVNRLFSDRHEKPEVLVLDTAMIKNPKTEKEVISKLDNSKSVILIATQMIFSHRYDHNFDLIGIPQTDALMNMPDFKSEENLLYQFEKLLDFQPEKIIMQTYHPENNALKTAISGNYEDFYDKELEIRKMLWYPPFVRLIKVSFGHINKSKASYEARILSEKLKMVLVQRKLQNKIKMLGPSSGFIEKERGRYVYNIILKIVPEQRPDEILQFVPSYWSIDVDPRSIL